MKSNIREEIANTIPAMLVSVLTDIIKPLTQCIENGGRNLPDLTVKIKLKNFQKVHALKQTNTKLHIHTMAFNEFFKQSILPHPITIRYQYPS